MSSSKATRVALRSPLNLLIGCLLILAFPMGMPVLEARAKTDIIVLRNGDLITGEIKKLERGKIEVKTDAMGTVSIKWEHIQRVTSQYTFEVELDSGQKFYGTLGSLTEERKMVVSGVEVESAAVDYPRVVRLVPLDASFLERLKGYVDLGYNFTQAQTSTQWSGNGEVSYRSERYLTQFQVSSEYKSQENAEPVIRNTASIQLNRFLAKRWEVFGFGQGQRNDSQELDLRVVAGGGIGRHLVRTNRMILTAGAGLALSEELFAEQTERTNAEAVGRLFFETFRLDSPEIDVSTGLTVFPNLSSLGRYRLEWTGRARFEIMKDLYWSVNAYDSYNSAPPQETAQKNDFGVSTSLGWSF